MRFGALPRSSRAIRGVFLGVAVFSSAVLAALGWQLLEYDRTLQRQREIERLNQARDRFASSPTPPTASVVVTLSEAGVVVDHGTLIYVPTDPPAQPEAPSELFEEGERLEHAENDYRAAAREFRLLTANRDDAIRAGALGRLARVQRKLLDIDLAVRTYEEIDRIATPVAIDGFPATLYARLGRAGALASGQRTDALRAEARALTDDLRQGRWPLSKDVYAQRLEEAAAWLGASAPVDAPALSAAEAVQWLWNNRSSLAGLAERGRILTLPGGTESLVAWTSGAPLRAAIAVPAYLAAVRADAQRQAESRRNLLVAAFAATGLVLLAGWYFIVRAIAREQRTLQLQHDFVSAVSHEFRSPLTSMAHVAEMLDEGRISTEADRQASYRTLVGDAGRLRRLVDDLLDFRRFESGPVTMRIERADVVDVVRASVADVGRRVETHRIDLAADGPIPALIDRDALARAVANLLDNAIKYSPDCQTVWVDVAAVSGGVTISVRDRGIGIPAGEQRHIFNGFVRGAQAKAMRIKGTGIGLSVVRQIARAHGGDVSVTSTPGAGSCFTIVLHQPPGAPS
jgi:signal transduction histidine kinase